jgi:hypothetical protein
VLLGPGDFTDQPIVALVGLPAGASAFRGRLSAEAGAEALGMDLSLEWAPGQIVEGEAVAGLVRALQSVGEGVCIAPAGSARIP